MRSGPAYAPHCERCSKPEAEVAGMVLIHKSLPTALCWDCVDDLKRGADVHRARQEEHL